MEEVAMMRALLVLTMALPAMAADAPSEEEIEIARLVKRAERAGYERHDLKAWWGPMAKGLKRTTGRKPEPDKYDVVLDAKRLRALLTARWRKVSTEKERLYFQADKVEITGDTAVYTTEASFHFFGGEAVTRRRYTLQRTQNRKGSGGWQVTDIRIWRMAENTAGLTELFNDEFYKDADEKVAKLYASGDPTLEQKLVVLVRARRFNEAYEASVAATKSPDVTGADWLARSRIGVEIGFVEDARKAFRRANKLSPGVRIPGLLE
jgi:hypothetical protein